jgi:hypothetical protein
MMSHDCHRSVFTNFLGIPFNLDDAVANGSYGLLRDKTISAT